MFNMMIDGSKMTKAAIRKLGGSHVVVVPPAYLKQTGLNAGSSVELSVRGDTLVMKPRRAPSLEQLIKSTPKGSRVPGWDEITPAGTEL